MINITELEVEKFNLKLFEIIMKVEVFCKKELIEFYTKDGFNKDIIENNNLIKYLINRSLILNMLMQEYFVEKNQVIESNKELIHFTLPQNTPLPKDNLVSTAFAWVFWGFRHLLSGSISIINYFNECTTNSSKQIYQENIKFIQNSKNKITTGELYRFIVNNYDNPNLKKFISTVNLKSNIENYKKLLQLVEEYNNNLENNKLDINVEYTYITTTFINNVIILLDLKSILDLYNKNFTKLNNKEIFVLNKIRNYVCHFHIVMGKYKQDNKCYLEIVKYISNKIIPDVILFDGDKSQVESNIERLFF